MGFEGMEGRAPLRLLFLPHCAIRALAAALGDGVEALQTLVPDEVMGDLERRLGLLCDTVRGHCRVEEEAVLPVLRAKMAERSEGERPLKRRRGSPVGVHLQCFSDEHRGLEDGFAVLKDVFGEVRDMPFVLEGCPDRRTRGEVLARCRKETSRLVAAIESHMDAEEREMVPLFTTYLTEAEQGGLLVKAMLASFTVAKLPATIRLICDEERVALFENLTRYAKPDELESISSAVARVLTPEQWERVCGAVPGLAESAKLAHNPLVEITHIHKAIGKELQDLVAYCDHISVANQHQVHVLAARFDFLRRIHSCHSDGEESVLMKELYSKLRASSPASSDAHSIHEEHDDEMAMFKTFSSCLASIQERMQQPDLTPGVIAAAKDELVASVRNIASHLLSHMHEEETKLLPLVRKHFSVEDQDRIVRRVMARVPANFLHELIPWMFNALSVDEQELMLRNLLRTAPSDEMREILRSIAVSVRKGMTDRGEWDELCLRIPDLGMESIAVDESDEAEGEGPVSEILRVHKAIRIDLKALLRRAKEISADGTIPNPRTLASLAESVAFLRRMVSDHSKAEDEILLPRLEERVPGVSSKYKDEHCDERALFAALAKCLEELQCVADEAECAKLVQKLHVATRTLLDGMVSHLVQEEEKMWPLLKQHFTADEQSEIVAQIFGQMPGDRLREMLPWMIRVLSVTEQNTMMNHILQVTKSTMFEKWLKTWLPLHDDTAHDSSCIGGASSNWTPVLSSSEKPHECQEQQHSRPNPSSPQHAAALPSSSSPGTRGTSNREAAAAARDLLHGRENMEATMRAIARDASLSREERTRMMQEFMLAPYHQARASTSAARGPAPKSAEEFSPTYTTDKQGNRRLGCKHYKRACKLRAKCCDRLYTCRLCHDDSEQTHILDRTATIEVLCMRCATLQPVASACANPECGQEFARYFCAVCKFYDDDEARNVYHCHSCNVCRVGRGLGQDFFHCMKCNQCMSMKYQKEGHKCVERAMESNCPVCHQYLFTSTSPVKYLRCGHLMHVSCFQTYARQRVSCPLCAKSLSEMVPVFDRLDKRLADGRSSMPALYRSARCDLFCDDCNQNSNTPYHFEYNKCPRCGSYNTRIVNVDANAGERRPAPL